MNLRNLLQRMFFLGIVLLVISACTLPAPASAETPIVDPSTQISFQPQAGTYTGSMEDGSTLRVVLISNDDQLQVQEVGYFFVPTGIEVKRIFMEGDQGFGEPKGGNTLTFQLPVMVGFFGPIQYYDVELSWDKPGEISCKLTLADPKDESLNFKIEELSIDATNLPEGATMKDNYELILKP
jgi:hypothetical protein